MANRGTLADPRWVRTEVETYRRRHPGRPVVAINVDGALDDPALAEQANAWMGLRDRIWIDESATALAEGVASDAVVARLATAPLGMRAARRWRATVATSFLVLAATAAAAIAFGVTAQRNAKRATSGRLAAESQLAAVRDPGLSALLAVQAWRESETGMPSTFSA